MSSASGPEEGIGPLGEGSHDCPSTSSRATGVKAIDKAIDKTIDKSTGTSTDKSTDKNTDTSDEPTVSRYNGPNSDRLVPDDQLGPLSTESTQSTKPVTAVDSVEPVEYVIQSVPTSTRSSFEVPHDRAPHRPSLLQSLGFGARRVSTSSERRRVLYLRELSERDLFFKPLWHTLIVHNSTSEARDFCSIERNFLSGLRASLYLGFAGVAIYIDFRLPTIGSDSGDSNDSPGGVTQRMSLPLGYIFFALSGLSLLASMLNYIHSVAGYSQQHLVVFNTVLMQAVVIVSALSVLATNILLLTAI